MVEYQYYKDEREEKKSSSAFKRFFILLIVFYAIIFIAYCSFQYKYAYVTVNGTSMQSTLNSTVYPVEGEKGEINYVKDGVYVERNGNVDYGDIVIFGEPEKNDSVIKRALAFEGDYVSIVKLQISQDVNINYQLLRVKNNSSQVELVDEEYIKSWTAAFREPTEIDGSLVQYESDFYKTMYAKNYEKTTFNVIINGSSTHVEFFKVPQNGIFYLGDNRNVSKDSRLDGMEKESNLYGQVVKVVYDGSWYEGNDFYFFSRFTSAISLAFDDILRFFGANI